MKKLSQFEYDLIKASWIRNGEFDKLKDLMKFEMIDIHNQLSLSNRIEQVNNLAKLRIKR